MPWYIILARLAAGVLLANGVPHFTNGISGRRFPSPFASPPGVGKSGPVVNVLWGMLNFAAGYFLLTGVGTLQAGFGVDAILVIIGALAAGLALAWHFGRV